MGVVDVVGNHYCEPVFCGLGAHGWVEIDQKNVPRLIEAIGYGPLEILIDS